MSVDRRDFLKSSTAAAVGIPSLAALLAAGCGLNADDSAALSRGTNSPNAGPIDPDIQDGVYSVIRNPQRSATKGRQEKEVPEWTPMFLYYSEETGLVNAKQIEIDRLPESGDMKTRMDVRRVRTAESDRSKLGRLDTASIGFDVKQGESEFTLAEQLTWTAVAAFTGDDDGRMPGLKSLDFIGSTAWGTKGKSLITLPGGYGLGSFNFFVQDKPKFWRRAFDFVKRTVGAASTVVPLLALPKLVPAAVSAIDGVLNTLHREDKSHWLLKCKYAEFAATQESVRKHLLRHSGVRLMTGEYLVVPEQHFAKYGSFDFDQLKVNSAGLLVPRDLNDSSPENFRKAEETLPELSYISFSVQVEQMDD